MRITTRAAFVFLILVSNSAFGSERELPNKPLLVGGFCDDKDGVEVVLETEPYWEYRGSDRYCVYHETTVCKNGQRITRSVRTTGCIESDITIISDPFATPKAVE